MKMDLITGRDLQNTGLDLRKSLLVEPGTDGARDFPARHQKRFPIGMACRRPPGRRLIVSGHYRPVLAGPPARKRSVREFTNTIEIASLFCRTPARLMPSGPPSGLHVQRLAPCPCLRLNLRWGSQVPRAQTDWIKSCAAGFSFSPNCPMACADAGHG